MTEFETKAREHLVAGGAMFPAEWVEGLIQEIDSLRRTNEALKSAPTVTELVYKHDALSGCNGYGKFNLRQLDRDRWSIDLNNEHIELYNKRGRRVRSGLGHNLEGDW
jgi:hypothetical protein